MIDFTKFLNDEFEKLSISKEVEKELSNMKLERDFFDNESYTKFCKKMNMITKLKYRNSINEIDESDENFGIIKQCIAWAFRLWNNSINKDNLENVILSYSILDYFFVSNQILNTENVNKEILKKVESIGLNDKISDICLNNHYSTKDVEYYRTAIENKNLKEILEFIRVFEFRTSYYRINTFHAVILKIVYITDTTIFFSIINKSEPIVSAFIISLFKSDLHAMLSNPNLNNNVFKVKGFIEILKHEDSSINESSIGILSTLLKEIFDNKVFDNPIKDIMSIGNLQINKFFHSVCGELISTNEYLIDDYLDSFNFGYDRNEIGKHFVEYLLRNLDLNSNIGMIKKITDRYYDFLLSHCSSLYPINMYTSLFSCILMVLDDEIGNDPDKYIKSLLESIHEIKEVKSSWNWGSIRYKYQKLFYLISYNILAKIDLSQYHSELDEIECFIKDERDKELWKDVDIDELISILLNPNNYNKIKLSSNHGIYTIEIKH